nr:hypothetical protein [Tanacetum cinerariifolium]
MSYGDSPSYSSTTTYTSLSYSKTVSHRSDSKALITVDTLVDWTDHDGESDGVIASKEFGMIVGCDTEDAIEEGVAKIYNLIIGADTEEASTAVTSLQRSTQMTLPTVILVLNLQSPSQMILPPVHQLPV